MSPSSPWRGGDLTPIAHAIELERVRAELATLKEHIDRALMSPQMRAFILEVGPNKTVIALNGQVHEVATPRNVRIQEGDTVHVTPDTHGILDVVENPVCAGVIRRVVDIVDDRHVVIDMNGMEQRIVLAGKSGAQRDDRVLVDQQCILILKKLPRVGPAPAPATGVRWDDIGGLAEAKRTLREVIEQRVTDAARCERYRVQRPKGILLCGPPGTGKTMLAKAAATAIAELHGRESAASGFQYCKGPELLHPLVGQSEQGVRALFDTAHRHQQEHGYPSVICLDEADALLMRRGASHFEGMERTIVPAFLAEMDGIGDSGAFVIVATNRPDILDPAVVREGRLDLKVWVARPTQEECHDILAKQLRGVPIARELEQIVETGAAELFSPRHAILMVRTKSGKHDRRVNLSHWVSGSMCAGLVARATTLAMRRERETGAESAIRPQDLEAAADQLCREYRILDHVQDQEEIAHELRGELKSIDKVK